MLICITDLLTFNIASYMVDSADLEKVEASRNELHNLLEKPQLQGIPVSSHCLIISSCSSRLFFVYFLGFSPRK